MVLFGWSLPKLFFLIFLAFFIFQYSNILDIRYASDDICRLAHINNKGYLDYVMSEYFNWDGRYSFKVIFALLVFLFRDQSAIINALLLLGLLFAIFCREIFKNKIFDFFRIGLIYLGFTILILQESWFRRIFFNMTLSLTYFLPAILSFLIFGLLNQKKKIRTSTLLVKSFILFIMSGFHETFSVILVIFFFVTLLTDLTIKKRLDITKFIFFLSALLGFLVMFLAPGNNVRISYHKGFDWFDSGKFAFFEFLTKLSNLSFDLHFLGLIFSLALIVTLGIDRDKLITLIQSWSSRLLEILSFFVISTYLTDFLSLRIMGFSADARHAFFFDFYLFILKFLFLFDISAIIILFGKIFFSQFRKELKSLNTIVLEKFVFVALVLLVLMYFGKIFLSTREFFNHQKFYADYFDRYIFKRSDEFSKAQGLRKVVLPSYPIDLEHFNSNPNHWTYECLSEYLKEKIELKRIY
ncbi:MAG: DUF6056 family protein [Patescibacteria group bacterium]|nr:DUF6056 family protein [Patescibacteria group bacterium]